MSSGWGKRRKERKGEESMFNLLRMDLYRIKRSKSPYVGLAFMLTASFLTYLFVFFLTVPEGQRLAFRLGMTELSGVREKEILEGIDTLSLFHHTAISGGMYSILLGVITVLFVCSDFQGGFIKNIMSLCPERWKYIGSKLITIGIINAALLVFSFLFHTLLNPIFHTMLPYIALGDAVLYLTLLWLETTAFAALIILICVITRSAAAGVMASVLLGGGIIVSPLASVMSLFRAEGWIIYTIYYNINSGLFAFGTTGELRAAAVGIVFLTVYAAAASVCLTRQDI